MTEFIACLGGGIMHHRPERMRNIDSETARPSGLALARVLIGAALSARVLGLLVHDRTAQKNPRRTHNGDRDRHSRADADDPQH
jgi:hypothetical protein